VKHLCPTITTCEHPPLYIDCKSMEKNNLCSIGARICPQTKRQRFYALHEWILHCSRPSGSAISSTEIIQSPSISIIHKSDKIKTNSQFNSEASSKTHPGLPGVLRQSVKLRTYPRIHRWENQIELLDLAGMMTSPTHSVDLWQCVIFRSEVGKVLTVSNAHALSTTNNSCLAARLCLFKTCG
jgi:hypothetical protein